MKNKIITLLTLSLLTGCATASKTQRVVNVENWPVTQSPQQASYSSFQAFTDGTQSSASQIQAKTVCETAEMRQNVVDYDNSNDTVRIMTVQDSNNSSRVLSEVEVDCRDYFLRKSFSPSNANLIEASTSTSIIEERVEPKRSTRSSRQSCTYIVQKGDTVWEIARQHCTTAAAVSRLNGLGRGNIIDIGQRLKLPDEVCD